MLSMLWEKSADPDEALRDRFGFDGTEDAVSWLSEKLARSWRMELMGCERIVISDTSALAWFSTAGGGEFVAKWTCALEKFARFKFANELLSSLDVMRLPVACPVQNVDGRRTVVAQPGAVPLALAVMPRISGGPLDVTDHFRVYLAGATLGRLHQAMKPYRSKRPEQLEAREMNLHRRITAWLDTEDAGLVPEASARLRRRIDELKPLRRRPQLVHGDFRAANILTVDGHITAVLDFDELAWDHRVAEVAHACVYLSTLFTTWQPTTREIRKHFLEGYDLTQRLSVNERDWLEVLILRSGIAAVPPGPDPDGWAAAI